MIKKNTAIQHKRHTCMNLSCSSTRVGEPLFTSTMVSCIYLSIPIRTKKDVRYR